MSMKMAVLHKENAFCQIFYILRAARAPIPKVQNGLQRIACGGGRAILTHRSKWSKHKLTWPRMYVLHTLWTLHSVLRAARALLRTHSTSEWGTDRNIYFPLFCGCTDSVQDPRIPVYNLRFRIICWRWGLETGDYGLRTRKLVETTKEWDFGASNFSKQICWILLNNMFSRIFLTTFIQTETRD